MRPIWIVFTNVVFSRNEYEASDWSKIGGWDAAFPTTEATEQQPHVTLSSSGGDDCQEKCGRGWIISKQCYSF